MHATLLHAMGIDQHRLVWNHNNRDEIPTVFGGEVVSEVFAEKPSSLTATTRQVRRSPAFKQDGST
jgi:hypothetical protein